MFGFLLVLLLLIGAFMAIVVLLQAGKGGGLASMGGTGGGTDTLIGGRQAATLLTKATWVSGGLFLSLALVLSVLSSRQTVARSILRDNLQPPPQAAPRPLDLPGTSGEQPPVTTTGDAASTTGAAPAPTTGTTPAPTTTRD